MLKPVTERPAYHTGLASGGLVSVYQPAPQRAAESPDWYYSVISAVFQFPLRPISSCQRDVGWLAEFLKM